MCGYFSFTLFIYTFHALRIFRFHLNYTTFPEAETSTPKHERNPVPREAPPSYDDVIDQKETDAATGSEVKAGEYQVTT